MIKPFPRTRAVLRLVLSCIALLIVCLAWVPGGVLFILGHIANFLREVIEALRDPERTACKHGTSFRYACEECDAEGEQAERDHPPDGKGCPF